MSDRLIKRSPEDFDWPATIFLYVVLIVLGVGMCFCLRQANRLIPNRFSFPLVDRGEGRQRGLYDLSVEEEGLLSSHYSDVEEDDDAEIIGNQNVLDHEEEEEEEFGILQQSSLSKHVVDHDDNELYMNPYKDDHYNYVGGILNCIDIMCGAATSNQVIGWLCLNFFSVVAILFERSLSANIDKLKRTNDTTQDLKQSTVITKKQKMDDMSSGSDSDYAKYWIDWFLETKGNEYYCEIDEEYILDRFNLTGLNVEVQQYYAEALDMITDNLEEERFDEKARDQIERAARHLYGLIHARFVITTRGLAKMLDKYKKAEFGRCPRVLCNLQPLLPVGLSDVPVTKTVKLYCPRCEDIYNPKSSRHASIDGAYFGTSFPHMLFQVHPNYMPTKSIERYEPRIFGFKIHQIAEQHRWQDRAREEYQNKLKDISTDLV